MLVPWFNKNHHGVIETIETERFQEDIMLYITDGIGWLSPDACLDFTPQVGDKVQLLVDDKEATGWWLKKVQ